MSEVKQHIINLVVEDEKDLYCQFNNDCELNEDVKEYIERKIKEKSYKEKIVVRIVSDNKVNKANVSKAFHKWMDDTRLQMKRESRSNAFKQMWMFIVGIVFIMLSTLLEAKVHVVVFTVISTIGAFAIWEASSIWIIDNPRIQLTRMVKKKLFKDMTIDFATGADSSADPGAVAEEPKE